MTCHTWFQAAMAALLAAAAGATAIAAQELGAGPPRANVPVLGKTPEIDGQLADGEWDQACLVSSFHHFRSGKPSALETRAWVGIDADAIYVAFRCIEVAMDEIALADLPHDSMTLFARDHVECFLMPDVLQGTFYHLSVDAFGNRHDECGSDPQWDGEWEAAARRATGAWSVEMRVPRDTIGMTNAQMALGNLCRTRRIAPGETSAWSPTFGPFHNPTRFGRFVFDTQDKTRVTGMSLDRPATGENQLNVTLENAPPTATVTGYVIENGQSRPVGTASPPACRFSLRTERDTEVDLVVAVEQDGKVLDFRHAANVRLSGLKPTPIRPVLGPEVTPALRWVEDERVRGISYAVFSGPEMPKDVLQKTGPPADVPSPALHLRGQTHVRIRVTSGDTIRFDLGAETGDSVFTESVYALFDPRGTVIAKGLVEAGTQRQVVVAAEVPGTHVLLVNSGPAMWNPFTITLHNPYWVLDARGKSRYIQTPVAYHSLRDCRLAGCNLALMAAWLWGIPFKTDEELARWRTRLQELCQAAQSADIRIIPYLGWGCSRHDCDSVPEYPRALTRLSVRGPQPCPASRAYWEGSFLRRALVIAELSKTNPCIVGAGLDPESYYFNNWYRKRLQADEHSKIWGVVMPMGGSPEKCICNECLRALVKAKGVEDPELPEDGNVRFDWVAENGWLDDLCALQQQRLETVLVSIRERIHAVNPDFCFAIMHLSTGNDWFRQGMARGLGSKRVPVFDFDEGMYTSGYSEGAVQEKLERYRAWDADIVHGGALWMLKHSPANPHFLAAQLFNFALHGHSYWIWPGSMSLWRSADRVRGYYSLSGYAEDYWAAIALANQEIDRRLAAPDSYRSSLERIESRPAIPAQPEDQNDWARKPCYPVHVYAGTRLSFVVPPGIDHVQVRWGFREALGEQTLNVHLAGKTREATVDIRAEEPNVFSVAAPDGGGLGWIELAPGEKPVCVGIEVEGAKPFFGSGVGMPLR